MTTAEFDDLLGGIRGLVIELSSRLAPDELAEVDELLEHAELGEALRTLAWLIVEEDKRIPAAALDQIEALADRMGIVCELPSKLREHEADDG